MKIQQLRAAAAMAAGVLTIAQAQAGETGFSSSSGADMSVNDAAAMSAAPVCPAPCGGGNADSDDLDNKTQMQRLVGVTALGVGAGVTMSVVGGAARDAVAFGKVKDIPVYGKAITHLPVAGKNLPVYGTFISGIPSIGKAAGAATIPTTLGQVPYLGPAVKSIPLAGPIIAGPANPIIVGAAAVDTYIIPKCQPCGYTESSEWTQTDFNSPPRIRSYVNYLAPLPYTHPPVYAPSTINTGAVPHTLAASDFADASAVNIPD
jgi:hypothetical protein